MGVPAQARRVRWLCAIGLLLISAHSGAAEQVIYENDWDPQWGQWFREYAQSFVASCPGDPAWVAVRGTSHGEGQVSLRVSVWEERQGDWVRLGQEREMVLPDDGQAVARWEQREVRIERGHRYQVRFAADEGWCAYWGSDNYAGGQAFADGNPMPDRDLFCKVCLDSEPADVQVRSIRLDADTAERGPTSAVRGRLILENRGETAAIVTNAEVTFGADAVDVSDALAVSWESQPTEVPGLSAVEAEFTVMLTDDAPVGELAVGGRVEWFDEADNVLRNAGFEQDPSTQPAGWAVWAPGEREGTGLGVFEDGPRRGRRCFAMTADPSAGAETLTVLESLPVPAVESEYRAGVWYRTAKRRDVNKGTTKEIVVVPKDAKGQPVFPEEEVHRRLRDVNSWWREEVTYRPGVAEASVSVSLRMTVDAAGQQETVWWDDAYLVPAEVVQRSVLLAGAKFTVLPKKPPDDSEFVYLYTDRETKGDWIGRYGEEFAILCAAGPAFSNVEIRGVSGAEPRPSVEPFRPEFGRGCARWRWARDVEDRRALLLPVLGLREAGSWDDEGEIFPLDYPGPNLGLKVHVPDGWHRLALYFLDWDWQGERQHTVAVRDADGMLRLRLYTGSFEGGLYKCIGVKGPQDFTVTVERHRGFTVVVSGIFLDRVRPLDEAAAAVAEALAHAWLSSRLNALGRACEGIWPEMAGDLVAAEPEAFPGATLEACRRLLEWARDADTAETRFLAALAAAEQARVTGRFQVAEAATKELHGAMRAWAEQGRDPVQDLLDLGEVLCSKGQQYGGRCAFDTALKTARALGGPVACPEAVSRECLRKVDRVYSSLARVALLRWFERQPGNSMSRAPEGMLRLGRTYHALGGARAAEALFVEWLDRYPENPLRPQVLFELAFVRANLWKAQGVKETLALMKRDYPDAPETKEAFAMWGNIERPKWPYGPAGP